MMRRNTGTPPRLLWALGVLLLSVSLFAAPVNVILMIGDGMGPDVVAATAAYQFGPNSSQRLALQQLAHHAYVTTYPAEARGYDFTWNNGDPAYPLSWAADSAAAATALACGVKTYNAAIGVDLQKRPVMNIVEVAQRSGMKTGVITSVPFTHATPAGFAAHDNDRNDYQGIGASMLQVVQPDVVMGAGHPEPCKPDEAFQYIRKADWDDVLAGRTPYRLVQSRDEFRALIDQPATGKILGLYRAHSCLPYRGANNAAADSTVPTLVEMTQGSLNSLNNPNGFFLMVEGGSIDWCNHANDLDGAIGETLGFDEAVAAVQQWIAAHGGWERNLLIITADHDTGYLNSVKPVAKGVLPTVKWGTDGKWPNHTNRLVDVYYQGAGSATFADYLKDAKDFERGSIQYLDNTDIFKVMGQTVQAEQACPAGGCK